MQEYLIIGDIAGQWKALEALIKKAPQGAIPLSVGDMCDRGPQSKEVMYFFKDHGEAILGNHDHFFLTEAGPLQAYEYGVWMWNGGGTTLKSFGVEDPKELPRDILDWLEGLPLYRELEENGSGVKAFVSHAVKNPMISLESACDLHKSFYHLTENSIIWNRGGPRRMEGFYQVCGHNSHWGLKRFTDKNGEYGICLDTSRQEVLTGMHWPSGTIYQQEYIK